MTRYILLAAALAPLAAFAGAAQEQSEPQKVTIVGERDAEWGSYRHAYKAAAMFDKLTRSRPLIQAHMQIRPREAGLSLEGLRIQLVGETTTLAIPVDAIGRSTLPMLKSAYDEDAVLRLNRRAGSYRFSGRYSIKEKESGLYDAAELRAACEQLISAQRDSGNLFRLLGKKCAGVTFVYPLAESDAAVEFRDSQGKPGVIGAFDGEPFESQSMGRYKVATYRFSTWPAQGTVVAARRPLAIGTLYE